MEQKYVTEKTLVSEIVAEYPEAIDVLMGIGMHCLGCPASLAESLEDACMVHGVDASLVTEAVNQMISFHREPESFDEGDETLEEHADEHGVRADPLLAV